MSARTLIKNGLLIDPALKLEEKLDLRIAAGQIVEKGRSLEHRQDEELIDASGLWVCPGFVDIHTHMRDLGQKDKEDLHTGSRAAAAGGFTTVVTMANTEPTLDCGANFSLYLKKIADTALIEVLPLAAVTKGLSGQELTNMVELSDLGAVAFSDDGKPVQNMTVLRRALEYAKLSGKLIISHAEDCDLAEGGVMHECLHSTQLGLRGIPHASETVAVARELEIVRLTGSAYHFTHISCAAALDLIRKARAEGLPVSADLTPHHMALSVESIADYDCNMKMNPPLRSESDRLAMIEGIKDGSIEAIATDHAPHTALEKSRPFSEAPFGIIGLETAFSVSYATLVLNKHIDRLSLIALLTTGPSRILSLPQPGFYEGAKANLCIIDPDYHWLYDASKGFSRSSNSPWHNKELRGKVLCTIYKGEAVYKYPALEKRLTTRH